MGVMEKHQSWSTSESLENMKMMRFQIKMRKNSICEQRNELRKIQDGWTSK